MYRWQPIRLKDARLLRQIGFLQAGPSLAAARNWIERHRDDSWLIFAQDAPADAWPIAWMSLRRLDDGGWRRRLSLKTAGNKPDSALLREAARYAFEQAGCYRLEFECDVSEGDWLDLLQTDGWRQEAVLRAAAMDAASGLHRDVALFAALRPEQAGRQIAFVPFDRWVFYILANDCGLTASGFLRTGEKPEEEIVWEAAEWAGLLDDQSLVAGQDTLRQRFVGRPWLIVPGTSELLERAAEQAAEYFQGQRQQFDLPLDLSAGSPFQRSVWQRLVEIPYGSTRHYQQVAPVEPGEDARKWARATGSACGANPLPIFVPCHRVIGKDGRLVGFACGLDIKEYLLAHEIMGIR